MSLYTFNIDNAVGFFRKFLEEREDYLKDPKSARRAINAALNGWHLYEWVYHEFKSHPYFSQYKKKEDYRDFLVSNVSGFAEIRELADGSKHFKMNSGYVIDTRIMEKSGIGSLKGIEEGELMLRYKMGGIPVNIKFKDVLFFVTMYWTSLLERELNQNIDFFNSENYSMF